MSDFSSTTVGVKQTMAKMLLSDSLIKYIVSNQALWENFGKMSSHIYRKELMDKMIKAELKPEEMFMVFFFFSVIKSQPRVVKAMKNMSDSDKNQSWYQNVFAFINNNVTQYVTSAAKTGKFPAVNIPTCNPALDVLIFTMISEPAKLNIEELKNRTTFSQLALNSAMQAKAKEGYTNYWTNIVKGTKNEDKPEAPKMNEDYYKTGASDMYLLLDINLKEIPVPEGGYTEDNINYYLKHKKIAK